MESKPIYICRLGPFKSWRVVYFDGFL
uniref:Uncharacterized protein n=1 Tax=Arundo donax TaxID=35708 RepID=A0A0A8ZMW6_ARUDO